MSKGIFICFTGIDGSGKTTLTNITMEILNKYNINSNYVYCGWRQFESFVFKPFIKTVKGNMQDKSCVKSDGKTNINKKSYLLKLKKRFPSFFEFIVLVDYYFILIPRLIIPLYRGKNIVCDRYFYDMAINTGVDLKRSSLEIKQLIKRIQYLFPKPNILFLVDISAEIAYSRKDDVPDKNYLSEHRKNYIKLPSDFEVTLLNGTQPIDKLSITIEDKVEMMVK